MWDAKFNQDGTEILGNIGGMHSSNELSLIGTCGDCHLKLGLVHNGATSETEDNTSSKRAQCVGISGIGCIDKSDKLEEWVLWERWQGHVQFGLLDFNLGEPIDWCTVPIYNAPQSFVHRKYLSTFLRAMKCA